MKMLDSNLDSHENQVPMTTFAKNVGTKSDGTNLQARFGSANTSA